MLHCILYCNFRASSRLNSLLVHNTTCELYKETEDIHFICSNEIILCSKCHTQLIRISRILLTQKATLLCTLTGIRTIIQSEWPPSSPPRPPPTATLAHSRPIGIDHMSLRKESCVGLLYATSYSHYNNNKLQNSSNPVTSSVFSTENCYIECGRPTLAGTYSY